MGFKIAQKWWFLDKFKKNDLINEKILFLLDAKEKQWRKEVLKFKQFIDCHDENNIKFKKFFKKIMRSSHAI